MMKALNEIKSSNPFKVPENYFDEANQRIIKAARETMPETKPKGLSRSLRLTFAVAAAALVFAMLSYTAMRILHSDSKEILLTGLTSDDLQMTYLDDIDILTLEENASMHAIYSSEPVASKSEIINYLLQEDIDLNQIYEFL